MADKRKQGADNREWGKQAEQIAADYLYAEGYFIRERNWRFGNTIEIDIIAEKDSTIIFVEVKARKGDFSLPDDAVDTPKRKKMIKGGDIYLRSQPQTYPFRLDVITVTGTAENYKLSHLKDAFLPGIQRG